MNAYALAGDCWPAAVVLLLIVWKWRNPVTILGALVGVLLLAPIILTTTGLTTP